MKWMRLLISVLVLCVTCSCASFYTQKTEAELSYDADGKPTFKIYNSKAYQGLKIDVTKNTDGTTTLHYSAEVVDSNTVASEVAKANAVLAEGLSGAVGLLKLGLIGSNINQ